MDAITIEPIFKTSYLGFTISVFPDRVVYRPMLGLSGEQVILAKQIASVDTGVIGVGELKVETTGNKTYKLVVWPDHKKPLRDAILGII